MSGRVAHSWGAKVPFAQTHASIQPNHTRKPSNQTASCPADNPRRPTRQPGQWAHPICRVRQVFHGGGVGQGVLVQALVPPAGPRVKGWLIRPQPLRITGSRDIDGRARGVNNHAVIPQPHLCRNSLAQAGHLCQRSITSITTSCSAPVPADEQAAVGIRGHIRATRKQVGTAPQDRQPAHECPTRALRACTLMKCNLHPPG